MIFLFLAILLLNCSPNHEKKILDEILSLEKRIIKTSDINDQKFIINEISKNYSFFLDNYENSDFHPDILFKYAELLNSTNKIDKAVFYYKKIYNLYPDSKFAPISIISQASCYDKIGKTNFSIELYNLFLSKYPNHPYVVDIKKLIKITGKYNTEIIKNLK